MSTTLSLIAGHFPRAVMYRMVTSFHVIVTPINKIAYSFHGKISGFQVNDFRKNKLNQLPHLLLNNVSCRSISRSLYPVPWNGLTCIEVTMEPSPAKTIACKTSNSNKIQYPDKFLRVPSPLADYGRCRDVEEGCLAFSSHGFCQQCLSSSLGEFQCILNKTLQSPESSQLLRNTACNGVHSQCLPKTALVTAVL